MPSIVYILKQQKVEQAKYLSLYSPGLDWILQCIAYKAPQAVLGQVLDKGGKLCKRYKNIVLFLRIHIEFGSQKLDSMHKAQIMYWYIEIFPYLC